MDTKELKMLAEKATPGPWWIDSHGHMMVSQADGGHEPVFMAANLVEKAARHPETGNLSHWPNDWDASFIATANPKTILELIAENEQLKAELECASGDLKTAMEIVELNQKDADCFNYLAECKDWPDEICAIIDCGSPGAVRIAILDQIAKERA